MINVSQQFLDLIERGASYEWIVMNGTQEYGREHIIGGTLYDTLMEQLSIGNVISSRLTMSFMGVPFDASKPLELFFRANLNLGEQVSERYQRGKYFISEIETSKYSDIVEITCYDALAMLNVPYMRGGTWTPTLVVDVVNKICTRVGITIEANTLTALQAYTTPLDASPVIGEEGTTEGEMLSYVAILLGGNFIINEVGELTLCILTDATNYDYDLGNAVRDFWVGDQAPIRRVRLYVDSDNVFFAPLNPLQTQAGQDIVTESNLPIYVGESLAIWKSVGGAALDVSLPFYGNSDVASNILNALDGISLIPHTATRAMLPPYMLRNDNVHIKRDNIKLSNIEVNISPLAQCRLSLNKPDYSTPALERQLAQQGAKIEKNTYDIEHFNARNIIAGTIQDKTGRNSWNLDTGEFATTKGTIGTLTIDSNGLSGAGSDGGEYAEVSITPTKTYYKKGISEQTYSIATLGAGRLILKAAVDGSEETGADFYAVRKYKVPTDPTQGSYTIVGVFVDNSAPYGVVSIAVDNDTGDTTFQSYANTNYFNGSIQSASGYSIPPVDRRSVSTDAAVDTQLLSIFSAMPNSCKKTVQFNPTVSLSTWGTVPFMVEIYKMDATSGVLKGIQPKTSQGYWEYRASILNGAITSWVWNDN